MCVLRYRALCVMCVLRYRAICVMCVLRYRALCVMCVLRYRAHVNVFRVPDIVCYIAICNKVFVLTAVSRFVAGLDAVYVGRSVLPKYTASHSRRP
jgi:hypothetical protein